MLEKAGFNEIYVAGVFLDLEWKTYHRIRKERIFDPNDVVYDPAHPSIADENNRHFILYHGMQIVAVAHVEFLGSGGVMALRSLATEQVYEGRGYASYLLARLEEYAKFHDYGTLKTHARPTAVPFYRKHGYVDMQFDDPSIQKECVDLGKIL